MAELTPKYIDTTNLKALAMLALVGAGAYVVVGGLPVVAGSLAVAVMLAVYHRDRRPSLHAVNTIAPRRPNRRAVRQNRMEQA
jgi:hypothetical protein